MGVTNDRISLTIAGYKVNLEIPESLTLVEGNSGTGKSLIFKYLDKLSLENKNILCINEYLCIKYSSQFNKSIKETILSMLKKCKNSFIVIDNADVLLDDDIRTYIGFDANNKYLIFGRNVECLWINENKIADLIRDDKTKTIYLDYYFKDVNRKFI